MLKMLPAHSSSSARVQLNSLRLLDRHKPCQDPPLQGPMLRRSLGVGRGWPESKANMGQCQWGRLAKLLQAGHPHDSP